MPVNKRDVNKFRHVSAATQSDIRLFPPGRAGPNAHDAPAMTLRPLNPGPHEREREHKSSSSSSRSPDPRTDELPGYKLEHKINEGSFAWVYRATQLSSGNRVAVKILKPIRHNGQSALRSIHREECDFLRRLNGHPNIIQLLEVVRTAKYGPSAVMELAQTDLLKVLHERGAMTEDQVRPYFRQMVEGLHHAHTKRLINRDIKLENLLLTRDGVVKIADWGFATWWDPDSKLRNACGSLCYCAPEILNGRGYIGPEVDVWSLGVCLFLMVAGHLPFGDRDRNALAHSIRRASYTMPNHFSPGLQSVIRRMLDLDGEKRVHVLAALRKDPWVRGGSLDRRRDDSVDRRRDERGGKKKSDRPETTKDESDKRQSPPELFQVRMMPPSERTKKPTTTTYRAHPPYQPKEPDSSVLLTPNPHHHHRRQQPHHAEEDDSMAMSSMSLEHDLGTTMEVDFSRSDEEPQHHHHHHHPRSKGRKLVDRKDDVEDDDELSSSDSSLSSVEESDDDDDDDGQAEKKSKGKMQWDRKCIRPRLTDDFFRKKIDHFDRLESQPRWRC